MKRLTKEEIEQQEKENYLKMIKDNKNTDGMKFPVFLQPVFRDNFELEIPPVLLKTPCKM